VASGAIKASSWGSISRSLLQPLDFRQLFKIRLEVAAMGEPHGLGSRESGMVLGKGKLLIQQSLPRATAIARSMAGFGSIHQQEESVGDERKPWTNGPRGCGLSAGMAGR
jgi:hypothetical protein